MSDIVGTQYLFRVRLERLGISQGDAARWLQVTDRTVRRWASPGSGHAVPRAVMLLLAVMDRGRLTPDDVDRIADDP